MEGTSAEAIVQQVGVEEEVQAPEIEVEAPKPEGGERYERNLAQLARRERQIRERESKLQEVQGQLAQYEEGYKLAAEDPMAFLEKHGVSEDDLVRRMIDSNATPSQDEVIRRQNSELLELKTEFQNYRDSEQLKKTKDHNQTQWQAFVDNTRKEVDNSEELKLVKEFSAHQLVADVILEYHRQNGEVLPVTEAGKLVEEHIATEAEKFFKNDTLRTRYSEYLTPGEESSKNSDTQSSSQGSQQAESGPKTLTNNLTAQSANAGGSLLSQTKSLENMAALLRWDS